MGMFSKLLLSTAAVGVAAGMAGLGTFATFTDTASQSHTIDSGTVNIDLGTPGGADNRLSVGADGMVPGDSLQRRVKLTNAGDQNLASVTLSTTASPSSKLDTDATNGLQMKLERCGGTWVESTGTPYTYTCQATVSGSGTTTVLARRPVIGSALALSSMSSLTAGQTDDLVLTVDLPTAADNTFQNLASTITYKFDATQRAATAK